MCLLRNLVMLDGSAVLDVQAEANCIRQELTVRVGFWLRSKKDVFITQTLLAFFSEVRNSECYFETEI